MTPDTERDILIKEIIVYIGDITKFEMSTNLSRADLGLLNFVPVKQVVSNYIEVVNIISNVTFKLVSTPKLKLLLERLASLKELFQAVNDFTILNSDSRQVRDNLINTINSEYDHFLNIVIPILPFVQNEKLSFSKMEEHFQNFEDSARDKINTLDSSIRKIVEKQQIILDESTRTLEAIQKASGSSAVSQQSIYFKNQANISRNLQLIWLAATIIMLAVTVTWGFAIFNGWISQNPDAKIAAITQFTLGKIVVLTGLYYGLVWCTRNFSASAHNYVVNKHKQNSLNTFEAFIKAAGADQETKSAVLLQTTSSIFSSQPSGYGGNKESDSDGPTKIIEILKSSTSKSSSSA